MRAAVSGKAASGPDRMRVRLSASAIRRLVPARQVRVGLGRGGGGLAGGGLRGARRAGRVGQALLRGVDLAGRQRGGERRDGLLAHRARLPRDQVRAQSGDDVGASRLLQLRLALAACLLGGGQDVFGRVPCGGGPPGRALGEGHVGQQGPQVA